jgi:hypothetical protein
MEIKLNTVGQIVEGDQKGWYIVVEHDEKETGGYYVYQAPIEDVLNSTEGFDDWLESFEDVEGYFEESNWLILWNK